MSLAPSRVTPYSLVEGVHHVISDVQLSDNLELANNKPCKESKDEKSTSTSVDISSQSELHGRHQTQRFRSASIVQLKNRLAPEYVTLKAEIKHLLHWEVLLFPIMILSGASLSLNQYIQDLSSSGSEVKNPAIGFSFAIVAFSVSLVCLFHTLGLRGVSLLVIAFTKIVTTFGFIIPALFNNFLRTPHNALIYYSSAFAISSTIVVYIAQLLNGQGWNEKRTFAVAATVGSGSLLAKILILEYTYIFPKAATWKIEWLITGLLYPFLSLLAGRFIVGDVLSFLLLRIFEKGSIREVMTFFSILVKTDFYFAGQLAIINLSSPYTFFFSIGMNIITEILGTALNIKISKILKRKVENLPTSESDNEGIVEEWLLVRSILSSERLILHTHHEAIGEKLVISSTAGLIVAVSALGLTSTYPPTYYCIRGMILLVAEMCQDLLQRRLLYYLSGESLTILQPRFPSLLETVSFITLILTAANTTYAVYLLSSSTN